MKLDVFNKVEQFFRQGRPLSFSKGAVIIRAAEDPLGVMWLESGIVEQYALTREGMKISVNVFKPPAFFPMSWAINQTSNDYFYAATSKVSMRLMEPELVLQFLQNNPDVVFDLLGRVYRGTDGLLRRLTLTGARVAKDRLIFELITECYRFGDRVDEGQWHISITQSALASRSGLARETVSRELSKLVDDELITLSKGGVLVRLNQLEKELFGETGMV